MFIRWKEISRDFYFETSHFVCQVSIHSLKYNVYRDFQLQQNHAYQYPDNNVEKFVRVVPSDFRITKDAIFFRNVINPQKNIYISVSVNFY